MTQLSTDTNPQFSIELLKSCAVALSCYSFPNSLSLPTATTISTSYRRMSPYTYLKKNKEHSESLQRDFFISIKSWLCEKVLALVLCFAYQHD